MPQLKLLRDTSLDIKAKYLFFFIYYLFSLKKDCKQLIANDDEFSSKLGISLNMFYRCRKVLVNRGIINVISNFCPITGKKINNIYEIN